MYRGPIVLAILAACGGEKQTKPVPAAPLVATTGAIELLPEDGGPLHAVPIADFQREFGNRGILAAQMFPDGLSPGARAGVNMIAGDKNVSWVSDGDAEHGFWFAYDENANADLRDDPHHPFTRAGDRWEVQVALKIADPFSGAPLDAPVRIRRRADGAFAQQQAIARKGVLALPKASMRFALVGSQGQFGLDHHYLAFDLDRDGKLDLDALDSPELFHVFEKTITLDDKSYSFELVGDGSQLTLRPLGKRIPPRPPLTTGTPAPDFTVTDLDGKRASLAGLRGKVVLVDFWSTGCGPCIKALPRLAALHGQHHARGFEIMSVAETSDGVREVLGEHKTGIAAIDDAAHALYRVDRFPMYFLIARDGTIACSRCQLDALEAKLASELAR